MVHFDAPLVDQPSDLLGTAEKIDGDVLYLFRQLARWRSSRESVYLAPSFGVLTEDTELCSGEQAVLTSVPLDNDG